MKKFLVIYRMDMEVMKKMMSEAKAEDRQRDMDGWKMWMQTHAADFVDMGGPTGKNTNMSKDGATETSNDIGGYSVIQAESKEAAMKLLSDNPHFKLPGSTIDLAEVVSMGN